MARTLITPLKTTDMSTGVISLSSATHIKLTTAGSYIKTGGSSGIDATRLIFWVSRNSSKSSTAYLLSVVSGSTAGKTDFMPGKYSTLNNLNITIPGTTQVLGGTSGEYKINMFVIPETAKFKDTDGYIKFNVLTREGSSATHASIGSRMGAIYVNPR